MTSSEDENADKASSFVDQKKGSKRSHLNVSERASSRASIAQPMRSSSNVAQITDEKSVKKARWSASRDRQTHVVAASLNTSDKERVAGKERRAGAANTQRNAIVLKPSVKNSTKKVSSVGKAKTMPRSSERLRTISREVESDDVGICCRKNTSNCSPSSNVVERTQGVEVDDKLGSLESTSQPECPQCKSTDFKSAAPSTESQVKDTATCGSPCIGNRDTDSKSTAGNVKAEPTEASSELGKSECLGRQHTRVSDDVELPEPVPPCVKCQGVESKSTPSVTPSQASDTKMESSKADLEHVEQQSPGGGFTGKPCNCSPHSVKNLDHVDDSSDIKVTKAESDECPIQLDCVNRKPTTPDNTQSEISEGTVLASTETDTINQQSSNEVEKPAEEKPVQNRGASSKPTRARSKIRKARPTKSRSRSQKRQGAKVTSRDRTQSRERGSVNSTKTSNKNCTLMSWNPFKKITKALSMSSRSNASNCQCDLSPEPNENRKEEKSNNAAKSDNPPATTETSSMPSKSNSSGCRYDLISEPNEDKKEEKSSSTAKLDHPPTTSLPSCIPCKKDQTTVPKSNTQSKSRSSFATKDTCRLCKQEAMFKKAKLEMSKSQAIADKSNSSEIERQCPATIPKCWEQGSKAKKDSTTSEKKCAPSSISKSVSTPEPKSQEKPTSLLQQCQPLPKCWTYNFKDKPKSTSSNIDKAKSTSSSSSCKMRCAISKSISGSEKDKLMDDSTKKTIPPSSSSSCRIHCPVNKSTSVSKPIQELPEKSVLPTSPASKCSNHASDTVRPTSTSVKESEEHEHKLLKKSVSPLENDQNKPKCWTHKPLDEPVCTTAENESKNTEKLVSPSRSPKCWIYNKANGQETEAKYKAQSDPVEKSATTSPSTKCWEHRTKHGPMSNYCSRIGKNTNVVQDSPEKSDPSKSPSSKCSTRSITDKPSIAIPSKTPFVEKSISPTLQKSHCVPQCTSYSTTDEDADQLELVQNSTRKPNPENDPCKICSTKSESDPILQKCQPLPKCWKFGKEDEFVKTSTTNESSPISPIKKKCEVVKSLPEKPIQTSSANESNPTSPNAQKKCEVVKSLPEKPIQTSSANESNPTSPNAQKKCGAVKSLPEKNIPIPQECNPLPKCWIFGTKDEPITVSSKTPKKCNAQKELTKRSISPILQKCQPLPKCWEFGTTASPKAHKKCDSGRKSMEKHIPPLLKCQPLPKCWKLSTKEKSVSISSTKDEKKCKGLSKCQPLPKCWKYDTKSDSVSTLAKPTSSAQKKYECKIGSQLKKETPTILQKTKNQCQPLPKCWTVEKSTKGSSSNSAMSQDSTDLNVPQTSKQKYSIEDICAKTSPTVSSRSNSITPQKDLCGLSCSRKVSAESNSIKSASTPSPIKDQQRPDDNTCSHFCSAKKPVTSVQTPAPSSSSQTARNENEDRMCQTFCHQQSSKQHGSNRYISTSSPQLLNQSSNKPSGISCHKRLSTESTSTFKCTHTRTTHLSTPSSGSTTKPTSTNEPSHGSACGKPCNLPTMEEEETTAPHTVKSTSAGASPTAGSCGKPCTVRRSITETSSSESQSRSSDLSSSESTSTPTAKFCQPYSNQKSIQHDTSKLNNNTTIAPASPNESDLKSLSNLCPPTCSTQFHKGQHQYNNTNTPVHQKTTSKSQELATRHSDEHPTDSSTPLSNTCQPCHSPNHSDKSASMLLIAKSCDQTVRRSSCSESTLPLENTTQNQTRQNNSETTNNEAASPACEECLRLQATPAPKCPNCAKKSIPTKPVEANSAVAEDSSVEKNSGGMSCPSYCKASTSAHETELKHTEQAIDNMMNEGPVIHPDSVETTNEDLPDKTSASADCMYVTDDKPRSVEDEPGMCCKSSSRPFDNNGCPYQQCSIPTTTAAPKKEDERCNESTKFADEDASNSTNEEASDLDDEEESSSPVQYTSSSCPLEDDSTSDEKDEASIADSQPKEETTKPPQLARGGLEKKPLKQAPKRLRKKTIVDANNQVLTKGLKKQTCAKKTDRQKTLGGQSGHKILYRSNRGSEYRQKCKKTVCGRRRYSSTDSEERTLRGRISYQSQPHIPVTLTHAVHLRRRHTDKSRERMLAELNKKKKHETRFQ